MAAKRVLMIHNYYRQRGGEDESFECEAAQLEAAGCTVDRLTFNSSRMSVLERGLLPLLQIWSPRGVREVSRAIRDNRPDVVHFQNTYPLVSRAAYHACRRSGVPVVQSLRNFRFLCPGDRILRDGQGAEGAQTYEANGLRASFYKGSWTATAFLRVGNWFHQAIGSTTMEGIDYIAPSRFVRSKFVDAGWDANTIHVKPNLISDRPESLSSGSRAGAVFVGRLSDEKGVSEMLRAWREMEGDFPLCVIGDGPLAPAVTEMAGNDARVEYCGRLDLADAMKRVAKAKVLVQLSNCYETFGRSIGEAFSVGTPVVASKGGAFDELVDSSRGILVDPEDGNACVTALSTVMSLTDERWLDLSNAAKHYYRARLDPEAVTNQLIEIYQRVIDKSNDI